MTKKDALFAVGLGIASALVFWILWAITKNLLLLTLLLNFTVGQ